LAVVTVTMIEKEEDNGFAWFVAGLAISESKQRGCECRSESCPLCSEHYEETLVAAMRFQEMGTTYVY